jgi:transposase-like protein
MTCPHCESTATTEGTDRTALGYRRFRCRDCGHVFKNAQGHRSTVSNILQMWCVWLSCGVAGIN